MKKTVQEEAAEVIRTLAPKNVNDMTLEEFMELPHREWSEDIGEFQSLVILPTENLHDSDFRCMEFVAIAEKGRPICRMAGGSDVIHLGGIGGQNRQFNPAPIGWSIDCLKTSGLLRVFCHQPITAGPDLSSFELFVVEKKKDVDKPQK